mmetsp:Transcript_160578/g.283134  ORF Transcript_160578/g.283134 Transcript_160578/m.283134 type:complete len:393 (-) Transcript_160578:12-1190(-)
MAIAVDKDSLNIDVEIPEHVDVEAGGDDVAVLSSEVSVNLDSELSSAPRSKGDDVAVLSSKVSVNLDSELSPAPRKKGVNSGGVDIVGRGPAVNIDSDSDEGSSSSSSRRSRSRSRDRGNKSLGAAAATALLTAAAPLDVDECARIVERTLALPTSFAMPLHHEGGTVAIMAETGTVISVSPKDSQDSTVHVSGVADAVGKALWQLQELHETHVKEATAAAAAAEAAAKLEHMEQLEIPSRHMSAVVGPNGASIADVRAKCGGIMIAIQPPSEPGGPLMAVIGPGERTNVLLARRELRKRLEAAEPAAAADAPMATATPTDAHTATATKAAEASRCAGTTSASTWTNWQPWKPSVTGLPVPLGPPTLHHPPEPVFASVEEDESENEAELYEL